MATTKDITQHFHKLLAAVGPDGDKADAVRTALKLMEHVAKLEEQIETQKSGLRLAPAANHAAQARVADLTEVRARFSGKSRLSGKPDPDLLTVDDVKKALWKSRPVIKPVETTPDDLRYMTALEDENAALHQENKRLQESLTDCLERILQLENAAMVAEGALSRGIPFMPVHGTQVNMDRARGALRKALDIGRKSGVTPDTEGRDEESQDQEKTEADP